MWGGGEGGGIVPPPIRVLEHIRVTAKESVLTYESQFTHFPSQLSQRRPIAANQIAFCIAHHRKESNGGNHNVSWIGKETLTYAWVNLEDGEKKCWKWRGAFEPKQS